jgi:5-methylcytosine-specific restriction endonuclease McrA
VRCPHHGFLWIPKPDDQRKDRRRGNRRLLDEIPVEWRHFCWQCRRPELHLKTLRPVVSIEVHHIIPRKDGGLDDLQNLQVLCAECHAEVHRRREAFNRYIIAS